MRFTYVSNAEYLKSGHAANTEFTIQIGGSVIDFSRKEFNKDAPTLNRRHYIDHHGAEDLWSVTTGIMIDGDTWDYEDFRELTVAVKGGQPFTFDPDGTASSVSPVSVQFVTSEFKRARTSVGVDGYRFSGMMREMFQ